MKRHGVDVGLARLELQAPCSRGIAVAAVDLLPAQEYTLGVNGAARTFGVTTPQMKRGSELGPGFDVEAAAVARGRAVEHMQSHGLSARTMS